MYKCKFLQFESGAKWGIGVVYGIGGLNWVSKRLQAKITPKCTLIYVKKSQSVATLQQNMIEVSVKDWVGWAGRFSSSSWLCVCMCVAAPVYVCARANEKAQRANA